MILHSATMEGYKTYKERTVVNFSTGLNLLSGRSGKGKSSIFDLISLHLLDKSEASLEANLNWDSNYFYTEVCFEHNNDEYKSVLEYTKSDTAKVGKSTRKLYKNDMTTPVAENASVKEVLSELLDPMTTDAGLFFKQDSRPFLDINDGDRLALMRKIQKVDFDSNIKAIDNYIKQLNEKVIELDNKIYSYENKKYEFKTISELEYSEDQIQIMEKDCSILLNDITKVNELKKQKEEYQKKIIELNASITKAQSEVSNTKTKLDNKQKELEAYQDTGVNESLNKLDSEISVLNLKEVQDATESIVVSFNSNKEAIEKKIEALVSDKTNYPVTRLVKYDETKINEIITKLAGLKADKQSEEKQLAFCKSGNCPTCGHLFETNEIELHEKKINELTWSIEDQNTALAQLYKEKEEHENKVKQNDDNRNKCLLIDKDISVEKEKLLNFTDEKLSELKQAEASRVETLKKDIQTAIEAKKTEKGYITSNFETKCKLLETEVDRFKDIKDSKELEVSKYSDNLKEIITKFNAITITDISSTETQYSDLQTKINNYKSIVAVNKSNTEHNRLLTLEKENDSIELEKLQMEKNEIMIDKLNHESAKTILQKDFPNYVIGKVIKFIEGSMNRFIESIYKPLDVELANSKTGIPLMYGTGKRKIPAKSGLSGAEKCIVQLSFNDIFNKKNKLGVMLIDESDSATDELTSQSLFEVIGNMLKEYKQIVVISHNNNMKDYMIANYNANIINL